MYFIFQIHEKLSDNLSSHGPAKCTRSHSNFRRNVFAYQPHAQIHEICEQYGERLQFKGKITFPYQNSLVNLFSKDQNILFTK